MMNNATTVAQVSPNLQFLLVCQYINILDIFFYNKGLISQEERHHSVPVVNNLLEYLHNSKNESETKLQLLRNMLKGRNLCGGGENETLNMKYVNEIYQNIINNALFSHLGYINGYLAGIINRVGNVSYSSLKKMVFQDLSENYTCTNFCSPGNISIKLTPVAVKKVFYDYIWPIFPEHRDNILGTSRRQKRSLQVGMDYIGIHGQETYDRYLKALQEFEEKGMAGIKSDKETLRMLRKSAEIISRYQMMFAPHSIPTDLWFVQTLKERSIVKILKKLEGKEFYFNDITLLTDIKPSKIIKKSKQQISLGTEVRYHIKCGSEYRFVDLALFHDSFINQFLVFPEIHFDVVKTKFFHKREFLVLELKPKRMTKQEWLKIRKREDILLDHREKIQSRRAEIIENAAIDNSLKTPLQTFSESEEFLKMYILKIDDTVSDVPTYDSLVQNTYTGISVPIKYNEFQITNNIFIDDVLYQNELYNVNNLKSAEETISEIFGVTYKQDVKPLLEEYWDSPILRYNMRFEDFFVLNSFRKGTLKNLEHGHKRMEVLACRLALRQSSNELIENPITLYLLQFYKEDSFNRMENMPKGAKFIFPNSEILSYTSKDQVSKNILNEIYEKSILFQIEVNNQAGIADLGLILHGVPEFLYLLPREFVIVTDRVTKEIINGNEVSVMICHNEEKVKERQMVKMVKKLNQLLSTDIKYYVNGIENALAQFKETSSYANLEIPGTRTELRTFLKQSSDYKTIFGEFYYSLFYKSLSQLTALGLSEIEDKKTCYFIRISLESLSVYQTRESPYIIPIDLWYTKTLDNPLQVDFLINLQGKEFYFNDITLLTDTPGENQKLTSTHDITTVRYHMQFDSQYGLVDLASFAEKFENLYTVFPEVKFYVKEVKLVNKRILDLELVKKPIVLKDWLKIRQLKRNLVKSQSIFQLSRRGRSIENAALGISLKSSPSRFQEFENFLKEYILNIDESTNSVPTYDMLAEDMNSGLIIADIRKKYKDWHITSNAFIDDVLFQKELYQVDSLDLATQRFNKIFNCDDCQTVKFKHMFEMYRNSKAIQHYLTFEDHCVLYLRMENKLINYEHAFRRFLVAMYRLALRQSEEEWIRKPITIFSAIIIPAEEVDEKKKEQLPDIAIYEKPFYTGEEFLKRYLKQIIALDASKKFIFYKVNLKNPAGTVNINRVYEARSSYFLLQAIQLQKGGWYKIKIKEREYDVLTLQDLETPKETRMIKIINKLNEL